MGSSSSTSAVPPVKVAEPPKDSSSPAKPQCKACCACPETKKARDQCIVERGEENCGDLIEAHKECMRKMGFNV